MADFKRVKTITSHVGFGRWLSECKLHEDESLVVVGWLASCQRTAIPSPYAYSPVTALYLWRGAKVFCSEVSHKRYEVYEVSPQMKQFSTEDAATAYHIRMYRSAA